MECLVTKLKASVEDDSLETFGALTFIADPVGTINWSTSGFSPSSYANYRMKVFYMDGTSEIISDSNSTLPPKDVKKILILDKHKYRESTLCLDIGTRYHLRDSSELKGVNNVIEQLFVRPKVGRLSDISHLTKLTKIDGVGFTQGNLSDLSKLTKITRMDKFNIKEEISNLVDAQKGEGRANGKIMLPWDTQMLVGGVHRTLSTEYNYLVWNENEPYIYLYVECGSDNIDNAKTIYVYNMTQEEIDSRKSGIWAGKTIIKVEY